MRRGGILARLARQSGVVVRGAPPVERSSAPAITAPAGIEVETERVVAPAAAPLAPVVEPRGPGAAVVPVPRAAPPTPATAPLSSERVRSFDDEAHPVVRVGEARVPAPAKGSEEPAPRAILAPPPVPLRARPHGPSYAIDEQVIAIWGEPEPPVEATPTGPAAVEARKPAPPPAATPERASAPPPPARFARALADARRWVSATPAPEEISRTVTTGSVSEPAPEGMAPIVVREQLRSVAHAAAPAMQELHVSIGKIEVVIDDPVPPATAARVPPPAAPPRTPPPVRRWSRHYLRG